MAQGELPRLKDREPCPCVQLSCVRRLNHDSIFKTLLDLRTLGYQLSPVENHAKPNIFRNW